MARILIVDDNAINRKLIDDILCYEGHTVFQAADGFEGLHVARAERPRLIISDINMPSMDGYEFVRRLREDPQLAHTPVIFHTAHSLSGEAQAVAKSCQVSRILKKPCKLAELRSAVLDALRDTGATDR